MKFTLSLLSVTLLLTSAFSAHVPLLHKHSQHSFITEVVKLSTEANRVGLDKCKMCIDFAEQALDELLNIILQVGVIGSCSELCQLLEEKTGSKALGAVCNILCDVVGIEEFIKIINKADLDPIYYCEIIPMCPINDNGDAKFTKFTVSPKSGPQGTFDINFEYVSVNGTGTGEIDIDIVTVDGLPVGDSFLHELAAAGTYDGSIKLSAKPDPDCDPTQGPCEQWLPGLYTVKMAICNGECGSKHPHSAIYNEAQAQFTISG